MELLDKSKLPVFSPDTLVVSLDGSKVASLRAFYTNIAKLLHFPKDFGKNLDALFDSLTSLDSIEQDKVVLVIHHAPRFLEKEKPAKKDAVMEIFKDAQLDENRYDDKQFRVFGTV